MAELIFGAVLGTILGGLVSWVITHWYYMRQVGEAQASERAVQQRFDNLSHMMRTLLQKTTGVDVDIKALVTAHQVGTEQDIEQAIESVLPLILQKHTEAAVLSAILDIPIPLKLTKEELMDAHRQTKPPGSNK